MRIRAGIVLIQENNVALIERHRAGLDYFVFPGGGVDEGETPEQAAVRETMEELGVEVAIRQKVAVVQLGQQEQAGLFSGGTDRGRIWVRCRARNIRMRIPTVLMREFTSRSGCLLMNYPCIRISIPQTWRNWWLVRAGGGCQVRFGIRSAEIRFSRLCRETRVSTRKFQRARNNTMHHPSCLR